MTASPANILQQYLIDQGIGVKIEDTPATDWPIFYGRLSDHPNIKDNAIAVYDTVGTKDGRLMATGEVTEHPGFQIKVRAKDYNTGFTKTAAITASLDALNTVAVTVGSTIYHILSVTRTGNILPAGTHPQDDKQRELFFINGTLTLA